SRLAAGVLAFSVACGFAPGDGGLVGLVLGPAPADHVGPEPVAPPPEESPATVSPSPHAAPPPASPRRAESPAPTGTTLRASDTAAEGKEPGVEEKLSALKRLRDRGLLSQREYESLRDRVSRQP
ncbi:MAG: SHOCT domain-containing protein, partial [Candidatus Binatia bacterium]